MMEELVKGKLYNLDDFNATFFLLVGLLYDKLGNGCKVDFPVCLESKLKWSPTTMKNRMFSDLNSQRNKVET